MGIRREDKRTYLLLSSSHLRMDNLVLTRVQWLFPLKKNAGNNMMFIYKLSPLPSGKRSSNTSRIPRLSFNQLQPPAHLWISSHRLLEPQRAQICHFTMTSGNDSLQMRIEANKQSSSPVSTFSPAWPWAFCLQPLPALHKSECKHLQAYVPMNFTSP
jgi:hypothetical protein